MSLAALGAIAGGLNQGISLAEQDQERKQLRDMRAADQQWQEVARKQAQIDFERKNRLATLEDEKLARENMANRERASMYQPPVGAPAAPANPQPAPVNPAVTTPAAAPATTSDPYAMFWEQEPWAQKPSTKPGESAMNNPAAQPALVASVPQKPGESAMAQDAANPPANFAAAPVMSPAAPATPQAAPATAAPPASAATAVNPQPPAANAPAAPQSVASQPSRLAQLQRLQQIAANEYNWDKVEGLQKQIDAIQTQADADNYRAWVAQAPSLNNDQLATSLQTLVNGDRTPINVAPPKNNGDGTFTFTLTNKFTGASREVTGNRAQIMDALQWHMDRGTAEANQTAARAQQLKRADGVKLGAGEVHYDYDATGRLVPTASNSNEPAAVQAARIRYSGDGSRGVAGAGGASKTGGKAEDAANKPYMSAIDDAIKTSDVKFATPDEAIQVRTIADTFAQGYGYDTTRLPPNVAMRAALNYVRAGGSKAEKLGVDGVTGAARREYNDPEYGTFSLGAFNGNLTADQYKDLAPKMLAAQGKDRSGKPMSKLVKAEDGSIRRVEQTPEQIAQYQKKLRAAAFDTTGPNGISVLRQQLEDDVRNQIALTEQLALAERPADAPTIKANAKMRTQAELQILNRKLNLIKAGMSPKKDDESPQPQTTAERLQGASGMNPKLFSVASAELQRKDAAAAAESAKQKAELEAGRVRTAQNKKLRDEAALIDRNVINNPDLTMQDLLDMKSKYYDVMSGEQRYALNRRILVLQRQALARQ